MSQKCPEVVGVPEVRYLLLVVSHNLSQAQRLADKVLVLRGGEIAQTLTRRQMRDAGILQELLEAVF